MYVLLHQKQKQKARRSPGTKIYKGYLGLIKTKRINFLNKNNQKNYIGLNIDKKNENISVA